MQGLNIVIGIFLLGGCGALLRYAVSLFFGNNLYAVLVVNIVGSFCVGLLSSSLVLSPSYKIILMFGFLGSLSTFSNFALQIHQLLLGGQWLQATLIFMGNNVLSIFACYLGYRAILNL